LAIGLRRNIGIDRGEFSERTGHEVLELMGASVVGKLQQLQLLDVSDEIIRLTRRGLLVCDWIAGELFAAQ
jgi:coproporphyrinogen III oxidase-like Fe-S oxidoreductase